MGKSGLMPLEILFNWGAPRKTKKSTRVIFCWIILFVNCTIVTNAIIPRRELCVYRINTAKIVDGAQQCLCALCDLNSNGFRKLLLIWFYLVCEIILFRLNGDECSRRGCFVSTSHPLLIVSELRTAILALVHFMKGFGEWFHLFGYLQLFSCDNNIKRLFPLVFLVRVRAITSKWH